MKRLKDFKVTERIPRPAIKVLPMPFGNDEVTRRIVLHHAKHIIRQHKKTKSIDLAKAEFLQDFVSSPEPLNTGIA